MVEGCKCSCCAEAVNRIRHGREPEEACNCDLYAEEEQCDCVFCLVMLLPKDLR